MPKQKKTSRIDARLKIMEQHPEYDRLYRTALANRSRNNKAQEEQNEVRQQRAQPSSNVESISTNTQNKINKPSTSTALNNPNLNEVVSAETAVKLLAAAASSTNSHFPDAKGKSILVKNETRSKRANRR